MELRKRSNSPFWFVDLRLPNGDRVRKSTKQKLKRDAERVAQEMQREVEEEFKDAKDGRKAVSLATALDDYAGKLNAERKAYAREARRLADKTLTLLDGTMPVHDLTPAHLERIRLARAGAGNGPQTIAHELKNLRAASRYAHLLGHRVPDIRSWGLPKLTARTRWLTAEEVERVAQVLSAKGRTVLLAAQRQDARDMLIMLTCTGMRWGELTATTWHDVDLKERQLSIYGSKTERSRVVPLPQAAVLVLLRRWADRFGMQPHGTVPSGPTPYVFPAADGKRRYNCGALSRAINAVCNGPERAAKEGRATIHSLRHTYASRLRQGGAGLDEVQDMLGHANLQMTRRYAHLGKTATNARMRAILDRETK